MQLPSRLAIPCQADWDMNDWSLANGEQIFSAYEANGGTKYQVITEREWSYKRYCYLEIIDTIQE